MFVSSELFVFPCMTVSFLALSLSQLCTLDCMLFLITGILTWPCFVITILDCVSDWKYPEIVEDDQKDTVLDFQIVYYYIAYNPFYKAWSRVGALMIGLNAGGKGT